MSAELLGELEKARALEPAVAVGRAQHGDLDALITQTGDAPGPLALDHPSTLELQAESTEELDRRTEVFDDDADVVQSWAHMARLVSQRSTRQYSPLTTKYEPRMVPASFDFWVANLNFDASSSGTSIPTESLKPTARFLGFSRSYMTLMASPLS